MSFWSVVKTNGIRISARDGMLASSRFSMFQKDEIHTRLRAQPNFFCSSTNEKELLSRTGGGDYLFGCPPKHFKQP